MRRLGDMRDGRRSAAKCDEERRSRNDAVRVGRVLEVKSGVGSLFFLFAMYRSFYSKESVSKNRSATEGRG